MILIGRGINSVSTHSELFSDQNGRCLIIKLVLEDSIELAIANIYAPNEDSPEFFENLFQVLDRLNITSQVVGGDFNLALDTELDSTGNISHGKSRKFLNEAMATKNYVDIWRALHPLDSSFTWHRSQPNRVFSRLDLFLVTEDVASMTQDCQIRVGYRSDHESVQIKLNTSLTETRGPGLWRFNAKLLESVVFVQEINEVIDDTLAEFSNCDAVTNWELLKLRMTEKCINYAKKKTVERRKEIAQLTSDVSLSTIKVAQQPTNESIEELNEKKMKLEQFMKEKTNETIFRAKCTWYEEGERSSKYFFNLERSRAKQKTVHALKDPATNKIAVENKEILEMCNTFYKKLYGPKENKKFFGLINIENSTISAATRDSLEEDLTLDELNNAISKFDNDKAPGCDGLTAEFYKAFWPKLKYPIYRYYKLCLQRGMLGISARRGVLSLMPKKDKNLTDLGNWRPLTLLNFDYKLLSKVLALRLQKALPEVIEDYQTGFMRGRSITDNIRKVIDVMGYSKSRKMNNVLLSIDFQKCFDSVKNDAIIGIFRYFGFGECFVEWVRLLFTDFLLTVKNNGYTSSWFTQVNGYHQGCCFSPLAFLLTAQCFAHYIKANTFIKGIDIDQFKLLISQFADDTDLFFNMY